MLYKIPPTQPLSVVSTPERGISTSRDATQDGQDLFFRRRLVTFCLHCSFTQSFIFSESLVFFCGFALPNGREEKWLARRFHPVPLRAQRKFFAHDGAVVHLDSEIRTRFKFLDGMTKSTPIEYLYGCTVSWLPSYHSLSH